MQGMGFVRAALALLLLPLAGFAAETSLPFPMAAVGYQTVPQERVFDGVTEAVQRSTVSAQTSGTIVELNFDVDDFVSKGQVILRFRDTEQKARLEAARANLSEAQARSAQAEKEYSRTKDIYARKLVSKSAMDAATAELKAARAKLNAAQAGVDAAQEQLDHTVVRAPYSGIVVKRHVEIGESATVGQPLMTGISLEKLRVTVALPQTFVDQVRTHGKASVILPESGQRVTVDRLVVFPYADPATHDFRVRVSLPEGVNGLYPGMLVKVAFVTGETQRLLVPSEAVVHRSEVTGVYTVSDNGQVFLRQVRVGRPYDGTRIEVLAGLQPGDRIALDPVKAAVYLKKQGAGGS